MEELKLIGVGSTHKH